MHIRKSMRLLSKILVSMQKTILVVSSLLIVIGLGITVTMRYLIKTDFFGLEELLIIPAFWLYFIGSSYGTYEKYHITVDLVKTYIENNKIVLITQLFTIIVTTIVSLIMTYWAYEYIVWSYQSGSKSSAWKIPLYVSHSSVLVGFLLMTIYSVRDFIEDLILLVKE